MNPASIDSKGVENYLEPLGKVSEFKDKYNFIDNAYILDNKLYSVPSSAYLKGIIYNKEVFDKAGITSIPKSEEEFLEALRMIKDRTYYLAFSKDVDTRLVSICNKCIYSFPQERIQMIVMQYMDPKAEPITLKRFIIANPVQSAFFFLILVSFVVGVVYVIRKEKYKNKKKHEMDIKRYAALSQLTDEYVFEYDFETDTIHFDNKFGDKFGFKKDVEMSEDFSDNMALNQFASEFLNEKDKDTINGDPFQLSDNNGSVQWYKMVSYPVMDEKDQPKHIIGKIINVQDFVEEKEEISKKADMDFLTSIYNRTGFERIVSELGEKYQDAKSYVFAVIDLDDFKSVNDSLGHLGGDKALKRLALKLDDISSDNIVCARYGGDEFVISMFEAADEVLYQVKQLGNNQYILKDFDELS